MGVYTEPKQIQGVWIGKLVEELEPSSSNNQIIIISNELIVIIIIIDNYHCIVPLFAWYTPSFDETFDGNMEYQVNQSFDRSIYSILS